MLLSMLTAGEDGQVKVWSCSGMLRSTLAQNGRWSDVFIWLKKLQIFNVYTVSVCMRACQYLNFILFLYSIVTKMVLKFG